jgi:probable phosphoglycerate mutase
LRVVSFGAEAEVERDLIEWNYGEYEGLRPDQIHAERPDWELIRDGCPGDESPHQVGIRAERVVQRIRAIHGDVLIFSSGHVLRVPTARWLGLEPAAGKYLVLSSRA